MSRLRATFASYLEVFKLPGALRLTIAAMPPRTAYGMISLSIYFKVQQETGSIAIAGLATGLNSLSGAATSGLRGAIMDRFGLIWPLRIFVPLFALSLISLSITSDRETMILIAALMGIFAPPFNLSVRPLWKITVPVEKQRSAFALDTAATRAVLIFAPVIATTLSLSFTPDLSLQICALLILIGGALLLSTAQIKVWRPEVKLPSESSIWRVRAFQLLLIEAGIIGFGRGAFDIGIPASGTLAELPQLVGTILALVAAFNVIGGLAAGAISRHISPLRAYRNNYLIWAFASIPLALVNFDWSIMLVAAFIGFFGGAAQVFYWEITEAIRPKGTAVQTIAWLWGVEGTTAALGITLGGFIAEHFSPRYSLALLSISIFIGYLLIASNQRAFHAADRIIDPGSLPFPEDPTDRK